MSRLELLPQQLEIMESRATLSVYLGGLAAGKTFVSVVWAVSRAIRGRRVLVLMPTFSMCRSVWLKSFEEIAERMGMRPLVHYTTNLSMIDIQFVGSGSIMIRSAEACERIRGVNADDGAIDEFGSLATDEPYKILVGRLRRSKDGQILLTGTPTGYAWARQICETPGAKVVRLSSLGNGYLPTSYLNNMITTYGIGTAFYRQEIMGEFIDIASGIIPTDRLTVVDHAVPFSKFVCRAWDTASSSGTTGDYTATALVSMDDAGRVHVHSYDRKRGPYSGVRSWMVQTIRNDGKNVEQIFENTQGGSIIMQDLSAMREFHGNRFAHVTPTKDKVTRALALASKMSLGQISVTRGAGFGEWLDELKNFPKVPHDDQTDALVHAVGGCLTQHERVAKAFTHTLF